MEIPDDPTNESGVKKRPFNDITAQNVIQITIQVKVMLEYMKQHSINYETDTENSHYVRDCSNTSLGVSWLEVL